MIDSEYIWHSHVLHELLADQPRLPHALLINGMPGIGKSRFARALAASLLCESPAEGGRACGHCNACGWFAAGNHPDFRLLERLTDDQGKQSQDIKIDQVRGLANFTGVGGHRGGRRPILIDPADALNTPAANALLKTLEEPAEGVVFLLVSSRSDGVPATIRSRCRQVPLAAPAMDTAVAWLQGEAGCNAAEAASWLAMAGGAPLAALALADVEHAAAYRAMLEAIARMPDTPSVTIADTLGNAAARQWLPLLQRWVMDLMRVAAGGPPRYFPDQAVRLAALASRASPEALGRAANRLAQQFRQVEHPLNPRLFCEESLELVCEAFDAKPRRTGR